MSDLNSAVTLIRTGQRDEAQAILKEIIRTEPHNIPAWFWMVETLETNADKLRVMEVCRKLNPADPKVQKAYDMLKEVQAAEAGEMEAAPAAPSTGMEKEVPAAAFAEVPVIQSAPEVIIPPAPEPEPSPSQDVPAAAAFAAVPVIQSAPSQFNQPASAADAAEVAAAAVVAQEEEKVEPDNAAEAAVAAGAAVAAMRAAAPEPPAPDAPLGETPPFVNENAVPPAVVAAAAVPALEPAPVEAVSPRPRRRRNLKWLIPAIAISFVVFLCAGISFIYIRQLFPTP